MVENLSEHIIFMPDAVAYITGKIDRDELIERLAEIRKQDSITEIEKAVDLLDEPQRQGFNNFVKTVSLMVSESVSWDRVSDLVKDYPAFRREFVDKLEGVNGGN